ncbi:MAG: M20 family metallopeptidase [Halanaeroarchaeum sp.]
MTHIDGVPSALGAALPEDLPTALRTRLRDLLAVDTQNPPGDTRPLAELVEDVLDDAGVAHERVVTDPAKPNVVATVPGDREETLLFEGHLDTVPFDEEAWDYDPLGEVDGDRIYGRGATDMKGGLTAMLETAIAYGTMDDRPPVNLAFAFVGEEEVPGDAGLESVLESGAVDADACIIGENTCEDGRHSVTVADKGSIWLTLRATGDAAHGSRPMYGRNAVDALVEAVEHLRSSLSDRRLDLPADLGAIVADSVSFYAPAIGETAANRLFAYPTVNLGVLEGGESINSVPESATARLDVRLTAGVETPAVLADVRACLEDHPDVAVAETSWSVGTYESPDGPLVSAVAETAESVVGESVYRRSATGGGDAKRLRNAGVSTVEFALGTDTTHAVDEYTTTDALVGTAETYLRVPYALAAEYDGN